MTNPKDPVEVIGMVHKLLESGKSMKALLECHDFLRDIDEALRLEQSLKEAKAEWGTFVVGEEDLYGV